MTGGGGSAQPSGFTRGARIAYWVVAWAFAAAIILQVFFAGLMIFASAGTYMPLHVGFGYFIGIFPLAMLVLAALARVGVRTIIVAAVLFGLYFLQTSLPLIPVGEIAALHTVVALILFGLAIMAAIQARRFVRRPAEPAKVQAATPP